MKLKNNLFKILVSMLLCISYSFATVAAADYYINETTNGANANNISPLGGWHFDESGGKVYATTNDGVKLSDTSYMAPVEMSREVNPISSGKFTFEMLFKLYKYTDGFTVKFSGNESELFKIVTKGNNLQLVGKNGQKTLLTSYTTSKNIGIRMSVDLDSKTVTTFINGIQCCKDIPINDGYVDKISISTPVDYKMDANISLVDLYSGYSLNERFITSGNVNEFPDAWILENGSDAYISAQNNASFPDVNSLYIGNAQIRTDFEESGEKGRFEFQFLANDAESKFSWKNGDNEIYSINVTDGNIKCGNNVLTTYVDDVWYRCELEADFSSSVAKLMINGKYVAENISLSDMKITSFVIANTNGSILVDDVLAYTDSSEEYSVPAPAQIEKDDVNIGVMRCDLWREGNHYGWDKILPYNERETYLGYYDDGNPDVSDWETKWLSEHGVDYSLHCWFLPKTYSGGPLKTPAQSFSLEDGYFHSKYSDSIDFAIMWENSYNTSPTSEIFKNNIVPYWIEHYLKDSRYMVINNKPVIGIYSVDAFLKTVGANSVAQAKECLDFLRAECVKLGYNGAYILCVSSGSDTETLKNIGFDAYHPYTWRDSTDDPATQKGYLNQVLKNSSTIDVVPTVGVGIDEEAWGKEKGQMCSPETFKSVLQYVYDTPELLQVGDMGKMLLLDNWNEYGEGHFMMPSEIHGFGYLDAVREVFVSNSSHSDLRPAENEKQFLGKLFPSSIEPYAKGQINVPIRDDSSHTVKKWSGRDGLTKWKNIAGDTTSLYVDGFIINYVLKGVSGGSDPIIFCSEDLSALDMKNITYVAVDIKRVALDPYITLYYRNLGESEFTQAKSTVVYGKSNGESQTVYFPVWKDSNFSKGVSRLRLDPSNSKGSFEITSIRLLKGNIGDKLQLIKDSETVYTEVPLLKSNNSYFACIKDISANFGASVSYLRDKEMIKIVKEKEVFEYKNDGSLYKNGSLLETYSPLTTSGSYYMLPLDLVADIFGYEMIVNEQAGTVSMNERDLYPEVTYNVSQDLENGKWKFRNLAEAPSCDELGNLWWGSDSSALKVTNETSHSGENSIYKDFDVAWKRFGIESSFKANTDYHFSFWMKNKDTTDDKGLMKIAADYYAFDKEGNILAYNQNEISGLSFTLNTNWQYFNKNFRIEDYKKNSQMISIGDGNIGLESRIYITQGKAVSKRVYIDDINIREIPSFRVYTKAISHLSEKIGDEPIVFTFSHDIDPWTVTADKILINGSYATEADLNISIETDEDTRETKLIISLSNPPENEETIKVELENIRDAWGREIIGQQDTTVVGGAPYISLSSDVKNGELVLSGELKGERQNATLILAVKKNDVLSNVKIYPLTQEDKDFEFITAVNSAEWERIEIFLLDNMNTLVPLDKMKMVHIEQFTSPY